MDDAGEVESDGQQSLSQQSGTGTELNRVVWVSKRTPLRTERWDGNDGAANGFFGHEWTAADLLMGVSAMLASMTQMAVTQIASVLLRLITLYAA